MKFIFILLSLVILSGCLNHNVQDVTQQASVSESSTPPSNSSKNPARSPASMSKEDAIHLVESKLSAESLRVSYLGYDGVDEEGSYILRQASSATTDVMEWYHVNPVTRQITCEILEDFCLEQDTDTSESTNTVKELSNDQKKALEMAKVFAKDKLQQDGYVEDTTHIEFTGEHDGKQQFQVWNPGVGGSNTIDWLEVDLALNVVSSDLYGDEVIDMK